MAKDADAALARAWVLGDEDPSDAWYAEYESLPPTLMEALYVEADSWTWHYTLRVLIGLKN
jgi:hypothetical protein